MNNKENYDVAINLYNTTFKNLFPKSFTSYFPVNECTHRDSREHSIFLSKQKYWVLSVDIRFDKYTLLRASPYIYVNEKGDKLYGWYYDGNYIACAYKTIHPLDDEFVVAWKKCDDELKDKDRQKLDNRIYYDEELEKKRVES